MENILILIHLASDVLVAAAAVTSLADTILRRRRDNPPAADSCDADGSDLPGDRHG